MQLETRFCGATWPGLILSAAGAMCVAGIAIAAPPDSESAKPMLSDQAFKNVQVLKGLPLDDFMGTMGVMTGSLSFDCSECHTGAGTDQVNWAPTRIEK
jgi:hypothetical protein